MVITLKINHQWWPSRIRDAYELLTTPFFFRGGLRLRNESRFGCAQQRKKEEWTDVSFKTIEKRFFASGVYKHQHHPVVSFVASHNFSTMFWVTDSSWYDAPTKNFSKIRVTWKVEFAVGWKGWRWCLRKVTKSYHENLRFCGWDHWWLRESHSLRNGCA